MKNNESETGNPICPRCGSEKTSQIYYSCPAQADCADCGLRYDFGEGIKILSLAEGIERRPQFYKEYLCPKCGKYKFEETACYTEEDKKLICKCDKESKNETN